MKSVVISLCISGAMLSGCALLQPPTAVPPPVPPPTITIIEPPPVPPQVVPPTVVVTAPAPAMPDDVVTVIAALQDVSKAVSAGGDILKREMANATANWNRARNDDTRLRLALYTVATSSSSADDQRALTLLEPWLAKAAEPNLFRAVAEIIAPTLLEKIRQMREEKKAHEALKERLDATQKQLDTAQQRLEALRQLERSLTRRRTNP